MPTIPPMVKDDEALSWLRERAPDGMGTSRGELAKQWGWDRTTVYRRLKQWAEQGHIALAPSATGRTIITVRETTVSTSFDTVQNSVSSPVSEVVQVRRQGVSFHLLTHTAGGLGLAALAGSIAWFGVQINAWYGSTLGKTPEASRWLAGLSVCADLLGLALPTLARALWITRRRSISSLAWGLWATTASVAVLATIGFNAINIADTTAVRQKTTTQRALLLDRVDGLRSEQAAVVTDLHLGRRPIQSANRRDAIDRELTSLEKELNGLPAVMVSDPQADTAAALIKWASFSLITLSSDDIRSARIAGMTIMPQIAGLVLLLAAALWQSRKIQ